MEDLTVICSKCAKVFYVHPMQNAAAKYAGLCSDCAAKELVWDLAKRVTAIEEHLYEKFGEMP